MYTHLHYLTLLVGTVIEHQDYFCIHYLLLCLPNLTIFFYFSLPQLHSIAFG